MGTEDRQEKANILDVLKFTTPLLLTVSLFLSGILVNKIDEMDDKIFSHLTNDEIHAPRAQFVNQAEFDLYQKMRDRQMASMENNICDIKVLIQETVKHKK